MHPESLPLNGGCRCGRVRLRINTSPLVTMACHCTGCQKMTGGAFSVSAAIPTEGFAILEGEPVVGGLRGRSHHMFCGYCMSWLFTRIEGIDAFVSIRATMLDDARWFAPFMETWTDEKLPWASTSARHSFPRFPPLEAYDGLIAEYRTLASA